jgi:DNA-binding LacI/PurR family transcriptional regulator
VRAELVVQHLVASGYKHIAYLSQDLVDKGAVMVTTRREMGYRGAMEKAGLSRHAVVVKADQTPRAVQNAVRHLLGQRNRPDAIFCWISSRSKC